MKKKVTAILILVAILISLIPNSFTYAVEPKATITVCADKTEAKKGEEITYSIQMSTKEAVGSIMFTLDIPEGLTYVSNSGALATNFTELVGNLDEADYTETEKLVTIAHRSPFSINGTVTLATFKCRVNENAVDSYTVGLKDVEVTIGQNYDILSNDECIVVPAITNVNTSTTITSSFNTNLISAKKELGLGEEFEVKFSVGEFENVERGFIVLGGQLDYDKNILEKIDITQSDSIWNPISINESNFKFVTDAEKFINETANVFTIKFRVKEEITVPTNTIISVKNIIGSNGLENISSENANLNLTIVKREDFITSEKYIVEDEIISRIKPNTTITELRKNINASQDIVIIDKNGNILENDQKIGTGMQLKVGKLTYTLSVIGDIDGDGEISVADLSKIKLHLIDLETLTGLELKSGNIDGIDEITLIDLAQMKLVIIDLLVI